MGIERTGNGLCFCMKRVHVYQGCSQISKVRNRSPKEEPTWVGTKIGIGEQVQRTSFPATTNAGSFLWGQTMGWQLVVKKELMAGATVLSVMQR